jgi:tRNA-binding protein
VNSDLVHQWPGMQGILSLDAFSVLDIRTGTIVSAELFPEARKPAYKLTIDFGLELGQKRSSAQLTARYTLEELTGKQIVAVVNFPPKRIAGFLSEVMVLGVPSENGDTVLLAPDCAVQNGVRVY